MQHFSVEQRVQRIVTAIRAEEQRLRVKYPILQYQDWLGFAIMLLSLSGMVAVGWLYYTAVLPAWLAIILAAIFASFSHELEHDLIHHQYFRNARWMQNLMMLIVWVMRPNTVNPWYRRSIHFLHHKTSGTEQDLEERLVGNGIGYSLLRFIVMFDGLIGLIIRRKVLDREVNRFNFMEIMLAAFPFATMYFGLWYLFIGFHAWDFFVVTAYPAWFMTFMDLVNFLVVVLIAPNFLRSGCLNFVTSNMHYYGGVNNLIEQTQVLTHWLFAPFHLFCFNFGSTHGIHHFVVGQPFYLRQMVARVAHQVMRENGVRFNDFSTFVHANRFLSRTEVPAS